MLTNQDSGPTLRAHCIALFPPVAFLDDFDGHFKLLPFSPFAPAGHGRESSPAPRVVPTYPSGCTTVLTVFRSTRTWPRRARSSTPQGLIILYHTCKAKSI